MEKILFKRNIQRPIFFVLLLVAVTSFVSSAFLMYRHISGKETITNTAKDRVIARTVEAATEINDILTKRMLAVEKLADDLTAGRVRSNEIPSEIQTIVDEDPQIHSITVAYKPFEHDRRTRLYAPYYTRARGKSQFFRLDRLYDYTKADQQWFCLPLEKGATWIEPYYGQMGGVLMTTYSVPFYKVNVVTKEKIAIGVVAADISLDWIKKIIDTLDFGNSGYGAVISRKGVYLYHPTRQYVEQLRTVFDIARESKDAGRALVGEKSMKGERGAVDHVGVTTRLQSWLIFEPIPSAGWSLHTTFIKDDIPINLDVFRRQLMLIVFVLTVLLVSLSGLVYRVYEGDNGNLWKVSVIVSVVLLVGIGVIWQITLTYDTDIKNRGVKITGKPILDHFMDSHNKELADRGLKAPKYVPTGIYVSAAEFTGANKILMSGFIWQKYSNGLDRDISKGFVLQDAVGDLKVTEAYSYADKGVKVVGWYFQATLYEQIDYSRYPVDYERVGIRIRHQDIVKNVVLIPDLESYKLINPSTLPGLRKDLTIPDWEIKNTFFELVTNTYNTNFGLPNDPGQRGFPELHFNIMVKRNLVDAFIRNMTPLIIVALLLFAVMFIMIEQRMSKKFAMDIGENLVFVGSMFFVMIFSHISTRARIPTQEIFYLEYFYFIMYIALLWVPVSAVLYVAEKDMFVIRYRDNYISKLLYWPAILGSLFVIALATFY
jgi:hypothetical protein